MHDLKITSQPASWTVARDRHVAFLEGSLDKVTGPQLERYLVHQLRSGRRFVVLSLENVDFANSTGFMYLVNCALQFQEAGGDIALTNLGVKIRLVVEMLGFLPFFSIFTDPLEALRHVSQPVAVV